MNFMVGNSQRRNREHLSFAQRKEILVLIELSAQVQDTKLKLVESHHSTNIFENWVLIMPKTFQNFYATMWK